MIDFAVDEEIVSALGPEAFDGFLEKWVFISVLMSVLSYLSSRLLSFSFNPFFLLVNGVLKPAENEFCTF